MSEAHAVARGEGSLTFASLLHSAAAGGKTQREESETLAGSRSAGVRTEREDDSPNSLFYLPPLFFFGAESIPPAAEFTVGRDGKR